MEIQQKSQGWCAAGEFLKKRTVPGVKYRTTISAGEVEIQIPQKLLDNREVKRTRLYPRFTKERVARETLGSGLISYPRETHT